MKCKYCKKKFKKLKSHEFQCKLNPNSPWKNKERINKLSDKMKSLNLNYDYLKIKCCCIKCKKEISSTQLSMHYNSKGCSKIKENKKKKCKYCNKIPRKNNHLDICRKNPNNKKENKWSEERKNNHSKAMKKAVLNNPDSYSKDNVSGRVKIYEYNGHKLKGTWELKVAQWLDSQNIKWESEVEPQTYFWEETNKWHLYFPDFYLVDYDEFIEVKGYKRNRDESKWKYCKKPLKIINKDLIYILNNIKYQDIIIYAPEA